MKLAARNLLSDRLRLWLGAIGMSPVLTLVVLLDGVNYGTYHRPGPCHRAEMRGGPATAWERRLMFCSEGCRTEFLAAPARFVRAVNPEPKEA